MHKSHCESSYKARIFQTRKDRDLACNGRLVLGDFITIFLGFTQKWFFFAVSNHFFFVIVATIARSSAYIVNTVRIFRIISASNLFLNHEKPHDEIHSEYCKSNAEDTCISGFLV